MADRGITPAFEIIVIGSRYGLSKVMKKRQELLIRSQLALTFEEMQRSKDCIRKEALFDQ